MISFVLKENTIEHYRRTLHYQLQTKKRAAIFLFASTRATGTTGIGVSEARWPKRKDTDDFWGRAGVAENIGSFYHTLAKAPVREETQL